MESAIDHMTFQGRLTLWYGDDDSVCGGIFFAIPHKGDNRRILSAEEAIACASRADMQRLRGLGNEHRFEAK
jgi:hypothetical protein